ncbi:DinB family protein [Arthrobacter sp. HY1533]|uniref:DinB family protein n=1 Tax=Arthrobacter sp. HY1533 TaxID=2970919 RepID=UPI0022BA0D0E|nr:DinB family protein [Arthrobacter sp. HY1533]
MAITPDEKDWTWVLERTCPECGFNAREATPASVATTIPALLPRWQAALKRANVEERPAADTWSVLEYGAHVRDVFDVFTTRLELMLSQDNPNFANWDQDQAAEEGGYSRLDPAEVSAELVQNGLDAASAFGAVAPEAWQRRGLRSNGSAFTVETLSGYFLHDVIHHLHDIDA